MVIVGSILGIVVSLAIALWLALTGNAVYALPLAVVIAALLRLVVRSATGKRFRAADMPGPDRRDT